MPYNSPYANSIADLILRKGQIAAQGQQQQSDAWTTGLTGAVNAGLGGLSAYAKQQEQKPMDDLRKLQIDDATRTANSHKLIMDATDQSQGDNLAAADLLDTQGHGAEAVGLRQAHQKDLDQKYNDVQARVQQHGDIFGKAAELGAHIQQNPAIYPEAVPMLKEMANAVGGAQLASQVPATYDPQSFAAVMDFVSKGAQQAQSAQAAIAKVHTAVASTNDLAALTRNVAELKATATTPEAWKAADQHALAGGAPQAVIDAFPDWSPDAPKQAAAMAQTADQRSKADLEQQKVDATKNKTPEGPKAGSFEDFLGRYEAERGQPKGTATTRQIAEARRMYEDAGRKPDKDTSIPGDWNAEGQQFLASVPAQWRKTVEKIAAYDEDPTKVASMRGGMRETLMQWVNQVNPSYDSTLFGVRAPMRKAFTSGPQSQAINSLNTAIGHLDQFVDVAKSLGNGSFRPTNDLTNWVKTNFGDSAPTDFEGIKGIMSGELASAFKKSGATDQEIQKVEHAISSSASPQQLRDYATRIAIPALGSKISSYNAQYQQVMGTNDSYKVLSPDSTAILQKYGYNPDHPTMGGAAGTGPVVAPHEGETKPIAGYPGTEQTFTGGKWIRTK